MALITRKEYAELLLNTARVLANEELSIHLREEFAGEVENLIYLERNIQSGQSSEFSDPL